MDVQRVMNRILEAWRNDVNSQDFDLLPHDMNLYENPYYFSLKHKATGEVF